MILVSGVTMHARELASQGKDDPQGRACSLGMTLGMGPTASAKRARIRESIRTVLAGFPVVLIAIRSQKGNSPTVTSNMG